MSDIKNNSCQKHTSPKTHTKYDTFKKQFLTRNESSSSTNMYDR